MCRIWKHCSLQLFIGHLRTSRIWAVDQAPPLCASVVTETILHSCILSTICNMHENISECRLQTYATNADLSTRLNYQVGSQSSDLNPQYSSTLEQKWQEVILNPCNIHLCTSCMTASLLLFTASPAVVHLSIFSVPSQDSLVSLCVYLPHHCAYGGVSY